MHELREMRAQELRSNEGTAELNCRPVRTETLTSSPLLGLSMGMKLKRRRRF